MKYNMNNIEVLDILEISKCNVTTRKCSELKTQNNVFHPVTPTYYFHHRMFQFINFLLLQPPIHYVDSFAILLYDQLLNTFV